MAEKKKQFKDYQDYLNSNEWKALKEEFYAQYDGLKNLCEVSLFKVIGTPHLHHWKYPKNWSDDSVDNLIMVDSEIHKFLHSIHDISAVNKKQYIQSAQVHWMTCEYIRKSKIINLLNVR